MTKTPTTPESSRDAAPEPTVHLFSLRWPDGREESARGATPAAAMLSLGYGFDDFRDVTWEVRN